MSGRGQNVTGNPQRQIEPGPATLDPRILYEALGQHSQASQRRRRCERMRDDLAKSRDTEQVMKVKN